MMYDSVHASPNRKCDREGRSGPVRTKAWLSDDFPGVREEPPSEDEHQNGEEREEEENAAEDARGNENVAGVGGVIGPGGRRRDEVGVVRREVGHDFTR